MLSARRPGGGEVVGPQRGQDQRQVGAQHPVVVEHRDVVQFAADLLGDGLAALGLARLPGGVEPGLEQPDQQPGHRGVGAQHPLDVVLAEPGARLAQVLGVGAQHHDLPPALVRVQDQRVEPVVLDLAAPQRGQRVLEQALDRARRGHRRRACGPGPAQPEVVDPERRGQARALELVRVLVDHLDAHVLQPGQHVGQRDRRPDPVDGQPPDQRAARRGVLHRHSAGEPLGLPHLERDLLARLQHPDDLGQVVQRVQRGHVGLVGLRDGRRADAEQRLGLRLAQPLVRGGGQVLVPGPHRGGQPGFQLGRVHLGQPGAGLGPHHDVQPGQRRVADGRAVLHRHPAEGLPEHLLGAQPHRRGVPVPGQVDQAGHVPAVPVPAEEQPGLPPFAQRQHAERDRRPAPAG